MAVRCFHVILKQPPVFVRKLLVDPCVSGQMAGEGASSVGMGCPRNWGGSVGLPQARRYGVENSKTKKKIDGETGVSGGKGGIAIGWSHPNATNTSVSLVS